MIQGKIWGETQEIFRSEALSVNVLRIRAGGFCSEHKHEKKSNIFHIVSGALEIAVWPDPVEVQPPQAPDLTTALPGASTAIPAGVWHQFRALEDTIAIEIYETALDGGDIVRRTHGGQR